MPPIKRAFTLFMLFVATSVASPSFAQEAATSTDTAAPADTATATPEAAATDAATTDAAQADTTTTAADSAAIENATRDHILGQEDAPLTIIEYASFTCPHCVEFEKSVWPKIQEEYIDTGKAKLVYREVYFDGAGLLAASLARCVAPEQYYPMVFTLYQTNENWLKAQSGVDGIISELSKLGLMAGLSKDQISACLDNRDVQEAMLANSQFHMQKDNVSGTPTLIVNGETVKNWQWDKLQPLLEEQYAKATK